jgi:protein TonB
MDTMMTFFVRNGHGVIDGHGEGWLAKNPRDRLGAFIAALLLHGGLVLGLGLVLSSASRAPVALFTDGAINLDIEETGHAGAAPDTAPVAVVVRRPPPPEERTVPEPAAVPEVDRLARPELVPVPLLTVPVVNSGIQVDPLDLIPPAPVPLLSAGPARGARMPASGSVPPSGPPGTAGGPPGVSDQPTALSGITPRYPFHARAEGQEGLVTVRVRVSGEGRVESAEVVRSSRFSALDEAALGAVRKARFAPAERGGRRVAGEIDLTFEFRLKD